MIDGSKSPRTVFALAPCITALVALVALVAGVGCEGVDTSARIDPGVAVSGAEFRPVAQVLVDRCGSIDCHGSKYRNMRLFGLGSGRLDPTHMPDAPETTDVEVERSYDAVVALEPTIIQRVIAEGGASPERLTFYRKARGIEAHKGGARILAGDPADLCLRSWFASTVDAEVCTSAVPRLAEP